MVGGWRGRGGGWWSFEDDTGLQRILLRTRVFRGWERFSRVSDRSCSARPVVGR